MHYSEMPDRDIQSGKYYDAWHWLWSKEKVQCGVSNPPTSPKRVVLPSGNIIVNPKYIDYEDGRGKQIYGELQDPNGNSLGHIDAPGRAIDASNIARDAARGWFSESEFGSARAQILTNQLQHVIKSAIERGIQSFLCNPLPQIPNRSTSTTADPKPKEDDLSRTEATTQFYDDMERNDFDRGDLRDDGRSDGQGESYAERQ